MSQKTTNEHSSVMLYGIDEQPPKGMAVLLAFQHILAAFAGIIAVPLVIASALGLSVEDTSIMVSASIFVAGIATILQSKGVGPVGSRVSGMMGTDFTFANPAISVGSQLGIAGIVGATIAGSFVEIVLSRFVKPLMRFFPPLITGTVVSLIGITLMPVSMDWAAGGAGKHGLAGRHADRPAPDPRAQRPEGRDRLLPRLLARARGSRQRGASHPHDPEDRRRRRC